MTNPYDPRNPDPTFVERTESNHPAHSKLLNTLNLLSIQLEDGSKLYLVVQGLSEWCPYDELQEHSRFYYEEHTCPTNYVGGRVLMLQHLKDSDPHGIFKFEEAIWKIGEIQDEKYLNSVFPN